MQMIEKALQNMKTEVEEKVNSAAIQNATIQKIITDAFTEIDRLRYATFVISLFSAWASWSRNEIWL